MPAPAGVQAPTEQPCGTPDAQRSLVVDVLIALVVVGLSLASLMGRTSQVLETDQGHVRFRSPDALGVELLVLGAAPLIWRRRAPFLVLVVTTAAFFSYHRLGYAPTPIPYAPLIALYTLALAWPMVPSLAAASGLVVVVVLLFATRHGPITDDQILTYLLFIVVTWGLGHGIQLNRAKAALLAERTVQLAREQQMNTRLAIEQEQARIARDVHDVIAHHVSVIVAQAAAVQRVLASQPEKGLPTLRTIEVSGRQALTEMRRMLGALQPTSGAADRGPDPGLGQIHALLANAERAGLAATLVIEGTPRALPALVDVNAYRIVQEALTNVLKHAGPARAHVLVVFRQDGLRLRICDDGEGGEPQATGIGLVGMRQRVAMLGGRLSVGPRPDGGFEVAATLPVSSDLS